MRTKLIASLLLAVGGLTTTVSAWAQNYPNRMIRIIVPFTPGGGNDIYARHIADKLGERLGQPVIVENRPGAGGNIGADLVAKSKPDGYTLLLAQNGLSITPWLTKNLPFDVSKDFAPIGIGVTLPLGLSVATSLPVKTVGELIAYAKANPDKLSYGSPGVGTPQHVTAELFKNMTGTKMAHIPYKGASGILTDLMSGQIEVYFGAINSKLPYIQTNKIRIIGVAEKHRKPILKDVPPIAETVPGFESVIWFGLMAPAGTPDAILKKLSSEQREIIALPDVREKLASAGFEPNATSPEEMRRVMQNDLVKWGKVIKEAGIKPE